MMTSDTDIETTSKLAMARLTPKGVRTRQHIVEIAAKLMYAQGVAGTTLEDVRDAANVSSSQLYHYFEDKNALVRAVVAYQVDAVVGGNEQIQLSTLEQFRAWRDAVVQHVGRLQHFSGCPLGSLGSELAESDPRARSALAAGFDRWETVFRRGLGIMAERGDFVPDADPDTLALALLAALQGGLLLAQVQRSTRPLEAALDAMLTLLSQSVSLDYAARVDVTR